MPSPIYRPGILVALAGSLLALLAFVLPFYSLFGFNQSLLELAQLPTQPLPYGLECFAALFTLAMGLLALLLPRWGGILPFVAGILGILLMADFYLSQPPTGNDLSSGFWLGLLGFLLTLGGGLLGLLHS